MNKKTHIRTWDVSVIYNYIYVNFLRRHYPDQVKGTLRIADLSHWAPLLLYDLSETGFELYDKKYETICQYGKGKI